MKNSLDFTHHIHRGARASAVALIAASLTLAAGYAQGTSSPSPSTRGSSTNPQAGQPDTGATTTTTPRTDDTSTSGSYGTSQSSSRRSHSGTAGTELKRSEKKFITEVAESSPKEIAMAQLAVGRASNPQIKSYAQQLISDHEQMGQELTQLAQTKGVTLEHAMAMNGSTTGMGGHASATTGVSSDTAHSRMTDSASGGAATPGGTMASSGGTTAASTGNMKVPDEVKSDRHYRNLSQKSGAEFDRQFVDMMVKDHEKDVKMFREQADKAQDPEVREFASKNVAVLQGHLDRAQTLNRSLAE